MKRLIITALLVSSALIAGCSNNNPFSAYSKPCMTEQIAVQKVYGKPDAVTLYRDKYGEEATGWRIDSARVMFLFTTTEDCGCRVTETHF
jgi:hypothetical protein